MSFITFRRYYLDNYLNKTKFFGRILDVGGKKTNKRGLFRPPLNNVKSWEYLNTDKSSNPNFLCNAENIPVEKEQFDIVILAEILEHLRNPIDVLCECQRVLKKNGKIIISIPFLYPIHADPHDFQRWTDSKIRFELEEIGFKKIRINTMGGLFSVIYDLLYVAINAMSKDKNAIKNKLCRRFILPILSKIFLWLDRKYIYKSKSITTGYYVEAFK